jgi:hypothetical protein
MGLPEINNINVSSILQKNKFVQETVEQIMKDFGMFNIKITFSGNFENAYNELHLQLVNQITILISENYQKLLSVLYQVDISEKEIKRATEELPHYNHYEIIAHQIIVRELKKVMTRHYFKMNS